MCDTLCILGERGTLFAKNSDRPVSEAQVVEAHHRRPPGAIVRTQYLEMRDEGAVATMLSRPAWLWGAEHGVNDGQGRHNPWPAGIPGSGLGTVAA